MKCFWKKTVWILLAFVLLDLGAEAPRYLRVSDGQTASRQISNDAADLKPGKITLVSPRPGAVVPTLNPTQKAYLKMPREERIKFFVSEEQRKKLRQGGFYPLTVKLQWTCGNTAEHPHRVFISESPRFSDAVVFTVKSHSLSLDNFKIARKYYWRVAELDGNASPVGEFTTEAIAPRLLRIETVWNVRDLGGRIGRNGRRVKQGLIYRSGGLNDNSSADKDKPENAFRNRPDLMKKYQSYMKIIDDCQKQIKENKTVAYLPKKLIGRDWLVCQPDVWLTDEQARELAASVKSKPVRIAGAEAYRVSANENYMIAFPPIDDGWMFFVQEFDSDADGMIQLEIGGHRTYVMLNGKPIFDTLETGPGRRTEYFLEISVRKGKNRLVAAVRSNALWRHFHCRQLEPPAERTRVLESTIMLAGLAANAMLPYAPRQTEGKVLLTEETKRYVVCDLGWKNDIDLRGEKECYGMTGSPAGPPVKWRRYTFWAYAGLFHQMGKDVFRDVFKIFLDPKNYPIDFHCIGGQDRTGTLAFILNALLGVSEEELFLDWEISAFWNPKVGFNHSRFFPLITVVNRYPGNTIQEKVENLVLSTGFTPNDIERFREFMLEK